MPMHISTVYGYVKALKYRKPIKSISMRHTMQQLSWRIVLAIKHVKTYFLFL